MVLRTAALQCFFLGKVLQTDAEGGDENANRKDRKCKCKCKKKMCKKMQKCKKNATYKVKKGLETKKGRSKWFKFFLRRRFKPFLSRHKMQEFLPGKGRKMPTKEKKRNIHGKKAPSEKKSKKKQLHSKKCKMAQNAEKKCLHI